MDIYNLDSLNEEQRIPVMDIEGSILVTAGAGSGKTRMLTHRIAYLISEKSVQPYNILAITFTNKAASEMKERLYQMLPDTHGLWVSTFHSMCVSILRKFIGHLGFSSNFSIYTEAEKERLIKNSLKTLDIEDKDGLNKIIANAISAAKNDGCSPEGFAAMNKHMDNADIICRVYSDYERELKKCNALDFDDLLLCAHRLLRESEEARDYYQSRFRYIHVDEFQDTNTIQYKLLMQLSAKHLNVFAVGDEDQSIYGWRGANIGNIKSFIRDYNAKIYKLEQNYRSTKQIIAAANQLISNNSSRIEKNLWTENEDGLDITYYAAAKDSSEADYVLATIIALRGKGYRFSDMAILMRVNALSRGFEQRLLQYNIPYKIFGGFKFFERKEVKDVLSYARMIANPQDVEALTRIINYPKRGIGDAAIKQLTGYADQSGVKLFDVIANIDKDINLPTALISKIKPFAAIVRHLFSKRNQSPHEFLTTVVDAIELKKLYADDTEENKNRLLHIDQLIEAAAEYSEQNPNADIGDYLQMVTLYTDTDEIDQSKEYVSIATVHSAKGLEFPAVFVVGLEEGLFPLSRASESNAELEEERRLMYVAITRAKKRLYLTRCRSRFMYGNIKDTIASRFLAEAGISTQEPAATKSEGDYNSGSNSFSRTSDRYNYQNAYSKAAGGMNSDSFGHKYSGERKVSMPAYKREEPKPVNNVDVSEFKVGMTVRHKRFGTGKIIKIQQMSGNYAEIEFASGIMTLALNFAPLEIVE